MVMVEAKESKPPKARSAMTEVWPQIIAVSIKNTLLITYGMAYGFPTILIPGLLDPQESIDITTEEVSWIGAILMICVPLGCTVSGVLSQSVGRKRAMQMINIPLSIAWLLFYVSTQVWHIMVALCIAGLMGGILEAPVLTYVAEISQPHLRGMLSSTASMGVLVGMVIQFLFGTLMKWRTVALVSMAFPILSILLLFIVPESPNWLIMKNRLDDAQQSLAWLRGTKDVNYIQAEYKELCAQLTRSDDNSKKSKISFYLKKSFLWPFALVSFTFLVGHMSGITTLTTYAVQTFDLLEAPLDKYYCTLILGCVQLLGCITCVAAVHYVGKRYIAFISLLGICVCFTAAATYAYYIDALYYKDSPIKIMPNTTSNLPASTLIDMSELLTTQSTVMVSNLTDGFSNIIEAANSIANSTFHETLTNETFEKTLRETIIEDYSWMPMLFLISASYLSSVGIRVLPWILIGEVYDNETRSTGSGLSGAVGYIFGFVANKIFLSMVAALTLPGTFWLYAAVAFCGCVVLFFILPETEGKTLPEIIEHFAGGKKMGNNVIRSKRHIGENGSQLVHVGSERTENGTINGAYIIGSDERYTKQNTLTLDSRL